MGGMRTKSVEYNKVEMDISSAHKQREILGADGEGVYTDQCIKFCTKCRNCFEIVITDTSHTGKRIYTYNMVYYRDFPSYGKEKKTCPRCLGQSVIRKIQQ